MADITGSYRRADLPIVHFEAAQQGERWSCVAKIGGEHFEQTTSQPSPWPCIEKVIGEALDSANRDSEPSQFDMNRKLAKPAKSISLRRRGKVQPSDLPEWRPPEN